MTEQQKPVVMVLPLSVDCDVQITFTVRPSRENIEQLCEIIDLMLKWNVFPEGHEYLAKEEGV